MSTPFPLAPAVQQRWVECQNVGSTTIPSNGLLQISGATAPAVARTVLRVEQPTNDLVDLLAINSRMPIEPGRFGLCTLDTPAYVACAEGAGVGESWGPSAGNFELQPHRLGFLVLGDLSSGPPRMVRVLRQHVTSIVGKAPSGIAALSGTTPGTGTVDVYFLNEVGVLTASTTQVTGYNTSSSAVAAGVWLQLKSWGSRWLVDVEDCG